MPIKERIVDLAAIATLVSGCGGTPEDATTTTGDSATPPWEQTGSSGATGRGDATDGNSGTGDGDGDGTTRGNSGGADTTGGDAPTSTSGRGTTDDDGSTTATDETGRDDELPPIPDLGGGMDTGEDDDDDDAAGA
jgi:hypothetical protein